MQSRNRNDLPAAATGDESVFADDTGLGMLGDVIRMLPVGVYGPGRTHGRFLLMNDAAAVQLGMAGDETPVSQEFSQRREAGLRIATPRRARGHRRRNSGQRHGQAGRSHVAHRPVRISGRNLLLSSSVDITEQKAVEDHLFRSAFFDELTGLPTRRVIEHRVGGLLQREPHGRFALAFLDIDNFKHINDYYGHAVGDALLVEVAKRISLDLRESDMLSRISGDEFLLQLAPIQSESEVAEYIQFTLERLKAPFFIDGSEVFASISIGVSLYPEHGRSYEVLTARTPTLRCIGSRTPEGKGMAAFFDAGMEREAQARMKVEQSLRLAILEKRFCCAFQPKVDIRTRAIKGIEALVRLRDDEGVIQAPGTFVNLAVELGLIDELTHLVLAEIVKVDRPSSTRLLGTTPPSASTSRRNRPATPNSCARSRRRWRRPGFRRDS